MLTASNKKVQLNGVTVSPLTQLTTFITTICAKMFGCCACNILCVGLVSLVLTSPLLFPCILGQLSSTSLTSDNTTVSSSLLQTALELLQTIPDQSYQDKVIDEITKNVSLNISIKEGNISLHFLALRKMTLQCRIKLILFE